MGDCDLTQKLVKFLVVSDGELKMTRDDTCLLVVTSSVASKFENFGSEVLKNSGEINWSTSTHTLSVIALP